MSINQLNQKNTWYATGIFWRKVADKNQKHAMVIIMFAQ